MIKKIKVEAENNELILRNKSGDFAIIPAAKRQWALDNLGKGCHQCIDLLVGTLPKVKDYAEKGGRYYAQRGLHQVSSNEEALKDIHFPARPYIVTKGDTISGIAKKHNVSSDRIVRENKIKDANKIYPGQKLNITKTTPKPDLFTGNEYVVAAGDTLSSIGKKVGYDYMDIADFNNIRDPNKISKGQVLKIPNIVGPPKPKDNIILPSKIDTTNVTQVRNIQNLLIQSGHKIKSDSLWGNETKTELLKLMDEKGIPRSSVKIVTPGDKLGVSHFRRASDSNLDNEAVIHSFRRQSNSSDNYIVIDKLSNDMTVYDPDGDVIKKYHVGLGKSSGSDKAQRKYHTPAGIYTIVDNIETEKALTKSSSKIKQMQQEMKDAGYKLSVDGVWGKASQQKWEEYSKKTGKQLPDIYSDNLTEYFNKLYEGNIIGLKSESGIIQGQFIHQIPKGNKSRYRKLKDKNPLNDDFSWGCINCSQDDLKEFEEYTKPGNQIFILPEEEGNVFELRDGKLGFTTNRRDKSIQDYNYTYSGTGKYTSEKQRQATYKPVSYKIPKELSFDNTNKFMETLSSNKSKLMNELGIDNKDYDVMAKTAFGIFGAETDFDSLVYSKREGLRNPKTTRAFEELYMDIAEGFGYDQSSRSSGLTQIRFKEIPRWAKDEYNITRDNLNDPEKSAIATMVMLTQYRENIIKNRAKISGLSKENLLDFLAYAHSQPSSIFTGKRKGKDLVPEENDYVKKVLKYRDMVNTM